MHVVIQVSECRPVVYNKSLLGTNEQAVLPLREDDFALIAFNKLTGCNAIGAHYVWPIILQLAPPRSAVAHPDFHRRPYTYSGSPVCTNSACVLRSNPQSRYV